MSPSANATGEEKQMPVVSTAAASKKKQIKFKKSPNAPKRFKSAFIFYSTVRHPQIRKELKEKGELKKTTQIAKLVAEEWKNLTPDKRAEWEDKSKEDKERYDNEKAEYTGPWTVSASRRGGTKDPGAPKRPMSAFFAYSNSRRAALKRKDPTLSNADVSRILSKRWKELPADERQKYVDEEFELRQKYKADMKEWREKAQEREKEAQEERKKQELEMKLKQQQNALDNTAAAAAAAADLTNLRRQQQLLQQQHLLDNSAGMYMNGVGMGANNYLSAAAAAAAAAGSGMPGLDPALGLQFPPIVASSGGMLNPLAAGAFMGAPVPAYGSALLAAALQQQQQQQQQSQQLPQVMNPQLNMIGNFMPPGNGN